MCGAVRFAADDVSKEFGICHCIMCQQWAGGPFPAVSARQVSFQGEENMTRFQSSDWAERGFCKICGSNIYYKIKKNDDYDICLGVFDDKSEFTLRSEIFIDRKPDCYNMAGDHARLTEAETMEKYPEFTGP